MDWGPRTTEPPLALPMVVGHVSFVPLLQCGSYRERERERERDGDTRHIVTISDRSFHVTAARAWNSLPTSVTTATSLASFKKQLKTSGYATWFTAGGAIRIAHYDVIDDVITRKV